MYINEIFLVTKKGRCFKKNCKVKSLLFRGAGAGTGVEAGEKTTRSRSRSKKDHLRNTGFGHGGVKIFRTHVLTGTSTACFFLGCYRHRLKCLLKAFCGSASCWCWFGTGILMLIKIRYPQNSAEPGGAGSETQLDWANQKYFFQNKTNFRN